MALTTGPISWWSWRPGIRPRSAFIAGSLLLFVALVFSSLGLITLVLGILDGVVTPLYIPGVVTGHTLNKLDGQVQLGIRLHREGFPTTVFPTVDKNAAEAIHDGDALILDYSPHLHVLYAVEDGGQRYRLPGASVVGDVIGSLALLLLGLILLPYPALLARWGWRDLYGAGRQKLNGRVVGLRAAVPRAGMRTARPGLMPRPLRTWYGVALSPEDADFPPGVLTFSISQEMYASLTEGMQVCLTYSPNVHYVYALERI